MNLLVKFADQFAAGEFDSVLKGANLLLLVIWIFTFWLKWIEAS
jgi:hypothetical protein